MKRSAIGILIVYLLAIAGSVNAQPPTDEKYTISLENRTFIPELESITALNAKLQSMKDKHVLIQLNHIPSNEEKTRLDNYGIKLLAYMPTYAWYVKLSAQEIEPSFGIRNISQIEITDKISSYIIDNGINPKGIINETTAKVRVLFFPDVSRQEIESLTVYYGKAENLYLDNWEVILNPEWLFDFAGEDIVQWIEDVPPDKTASLDVIRTNIHANEVQTTPYNLHGNGYVAAMWDGGSVYAHPDFWSRVLAEPDGAPDGLHATKVAGVMAGDGTRSQACGGSEFQWRGIATQANIVSYEWNDELNEHDSAINTYEADVSQNSWTWNSCNVQLCEWFGDYASDSQYYDWIANGKYGDKITIVGGAGNDGLCTICQSQLPNFPYGTVAGPIATAKNILSVSGTRADNDEMWPASSWGPTDDGRIKPDLSAPACKSYGGIKTTATNNCYAENSCGTSYSAPAVSGSAILIYEDYNNFYSQDPLPSTVRAILYHSSEDLGNVGPDYKYGYGRLNIQRAIDIIREDNGANLRIVENQVIHSEVHDYYAGVQAGQPELKNTLVWDDRRATAGSGIKLINNLDLVLISPSGVRYYPWVLDWNNPGNPATTGIDSRNNMEQVFVDNPEAGLWTVRVTGAVVPYAPQQYSLIGESWQAPGTINGFVTNASSSDSIAGVIVEVLDSVTIIGSYSTAINGFYEIPDIPPDTFDVRFSHLDYRDTIISDVVFAPGDTVFLDVEMEYFGYAYLPGDMNMWYGDWPPALVGGDLTYYVNYMRMMPASVPCYLNGFWASADVNGTCIVDGADLSSVVSVFRQIMSPMYCPDYLPLYPPIPQDPPSGWPNCDNSPVTTGIKVIPAERGK